VVGGGGFIEMERLKSAAPKRHLLYMLTLFLTAGSLHAGEPKPELVSENYEIERIRANAVDQLSRTVMSSLYEINKRMRSMSKKKDDLSNKMLTVENHVKDLARNTADLEEKLGEQRHQLSKRLRAMYMLGDEGVVRVIFSSSSAIELDRSMKYLKKISQHDLALINTYKENLAELTKRKLKLTKEVKSLLSLKDSIKKQENMLEKDQASKSGLLHQLANDKRVTIEKMATLRGHAEDQQILDMLNLSFFEQKGKLNQPVHGVVAQGFGLIQNKDFNYKLSHKGYDYKMQGEQTVSTVFKGRIAFAGVIGGYGQTVIVDHGDHFYTVYAGLEKIVVNEGQKVENETTIAQAKNAMYFELRHFSDAIDPHPWLRETKSL
jgi:murein hydrolase activator